MALTDYQVERRDVVVKGKPLFQVQGLSLEGLSILVRTHLPDLEAIFDLVSRTGDLSQVADQSFDTIALTLVANAPGLTANIIAVASGEADIEAATNAARRLPFPAQMEALIHIGELTFEEVGGIKKCGEALVKILDQIQVGRHLRAASSSITTTESDAT